MLNLNIDVLVECIKTLSDNTQCVTCDNLNGPRVRFPCGHSVCKSCAERAEECLFCDSFPNGSYVVDKHQTSRLNNTLALLTAFQESFKIDVDKRQRISDQLKLEKQIFPQCIQAPNKYSNKRKSLNVSVTNKENIDPTIFLGEQIINIDATKMKKIQFVQNWLNQHEDVSQSLPRRPFGDLNINTQVHKEKRSVSKQRKVNTQVKASKQTYRKRTHCKDSSLLKNIENASFKCDNFEKQLDRKIMKKQKPIKSDLKSKCDRNESGIVIDDEPILIEDSEKEIIDKDNQAWLAVLETAKRDECKQIISEPGLQCYDSLLNNNDSALSPSIINGNKSIENAKGNVSKTVLFYKKSPLFSPCQHFKNHIQNPIDDKNKDVSIVINNSAFITTIKFTQCVENKAVDEKKSSVAIQTDKHENEAINKLECNSQLKRKMPLNDVIPTKTVKSNIATQSLDVFPTDRAPKSTRIEQFPHNKQADINKSLRHSNNLVVEESDTDSNTCHDNIHQVIAEIHRTTDHEKIETQRGILSTISKSNDLNRSRQPLRGRTPNSTDSSDKENFDPNRKRQTKCGKKPKNKK